MSYLASHCFRSADQAYALAIRADERGQTDSFLFWFRVYQECKFDAEQSLRSLAGSVSLRGYRPPFPLRTNSSQVNRWTAD